jgi:hypothetical protein
MSRSETLLQLQISNPVPRAEMATTQAADRVEQRAGPHASQTHGSDESVIGPDGAPMAPSGDRGAPTGQPIAQSQSSHYNQPFSPHMHQPGSMPPSHGDPSAASPYPQGTPICQPAQVIRPGIL